MNQEKYNLRWQTYTDHLKIMMKELMMNEDFSDVTIVTEDKKQVKANINILSVCSPLLKDIFKKENNSNSIIYLRGIQYPEIESIIQFIYLGEVNIYEDRMDEFLAVGKLLEIKELSNAVIETSNKPKEELRTNDPLTLTEKVEEKYVLSDQISIKQAAQERIGTVVNSNGKYKCEQCENTYASQGSLNKHKQTIHEGIKYDCYECEKRFTTQGILNKHILSVHEGVKYACDQCDSKASTEWNLSQHILDKHKGVKYSCNHCDYQATRRGNLKQHVKRLHSTL